MGRKLYMTETVILPPVSSSSAEIAQAPHWKVAHKTQGGWEGSLDIIAVLKEEQAGETC